MSEFNRGIFLPHPIDSLAGLVFPLNRLVELLELVDKLLALDGTSPTSVQGGSNMFAIVSRSYGRTR